MFSPEELSKAGEHLASGDGSIAEDYSSPSILSSRLFKVCGPNAADLIVELVTKQGYVVSYVVSSSILSTASPVFAKMLEPHLPYAKSTPGPILEIYDDDPETLLVLFRAMHWDNNHVPSVLYDFDDLVKLAVVADKYDCVKVFEPWRNAWLEPWSKIALKPGMEDWLFVSAVFGDERNFEELSRTLIEESWAIPTEGDSYTRSVTSGRPGHDDMNEKRYYASVNTLLIPERVINEIRRRRFQLIQRLHFRAWSLAQFLKGESNSGLSNEETSTEEISFRLRASLGPLKNSAPYLPSPGSTPNRNNDDKCMTVAYGCFARRAQCLCIWDYIQIKPSDLKIDTVQESPLVFYNALKSAVMAITVLYGQVAVYLSVHNKDSTINGNGCESCARRALFIEAIDRIMECEVEGLQAQDFMRNRAAKNVGWEAIDFDDTDLESTVVELRLFRLDNGDCQF